jgi:hypothetical protein
MDKSLYIWTRNVVKGLIPVYPVKLLSFRINSILFVYKRIIRLILEIWFLIKGISFFKIRIPFRRIGIPILNIRIRL